MKSLTLPSIAAAILAVSVISIVRSQPHATSTNPPLPPPSSTFPECVAAVGLIEPKSENIAIGVPLSALVEKVFVKPGDQVTAGTPLIQLDTRALSAQRLKAEADAASLDAAIPTASANIQSARATLSEAEAVLAMAESLPAAAARLSREEMTRRRSTRDAAAARLTSAESSLAAARAAAAAAHAATAVITTDITRSTILAPIDGHILQVRIRPGEFAASPASSNLILMGDLSHLHVRVDVDEHEAVRVRDGAPASAVVRGHHLSRQSLVFVRFEPCVIPKVSLTGSANERVDTRVLQVIYRIDQPTARLFPGQQMDVFIEADPAATF
jgi:multidrug resistance efflux pump